MNREQAETLLAALVADELDEPVRGELMAYLKTDAALAERLGDMRLAAGLLREGLEQASADIPTALGDTRREALLALIEREPIPAEAVPPAIRSGLGPLFSIRNAGAVAACAALGVGLVGMMLPELGEARRTARRIISEAPPAADYAYYDQEARAVDGYIELPGAELSDLSPLEYEFGMLSYISPADDLDLVGGTSLRYDKIVITDEHQAGDLLSEASGTLALGNDVNFYRTLDANKLALGVDTSGPKNSSAPVAPVITPSVDPPVPGVLDPAEPLQSRDYWQRTTTAGEQLAELIDTRESGWKARDQKPNTTGNLIEPEPSPEPSDENRFVPTERDGIAIISDRRELGLEGLSPDAPKGVSVPGSTGTFGALTLPDDWSGTVLWNNNHIGIEPDVSVRMGFGNDRFAFDKQLEQGPVFDQTRLDGRATNGLVDFDQRQGQGSGSPDSLGLGDKDWYDYIGGSKQGLVDGFEREAGLRTIGTTGVPDEAVLPKPSEPASPVTGSTFSIDVSKDRADLEGQIAELQGKLEQAQVTVDRNSAAMQIAAGESEAKDERFSAQSEQLKQQLDVISELQTQRDELTTLLIEERSRQRRLSDNYRRIQEETESIASQLDRVPSFGNAPGFDLNNALSNTSSGAGSGNAADGDLMIEARRNTSADKAKKGEASLNAGQLNAAVQYFEDAALLDPDNTTYQEKLTEAKSKLKEQLRPAGVLDQATVDRTVDRRTAIAEYQKAMTEATKSLEQQDYLAANNAIIEARTILSRERQVFDTEDYNARIDRANQFQDLNQTAQARVEADQLRRIEQHRGATESRIAKETESRKTQEIQALLRKARALQLEKKYDESVAELDAALFLDPDNQVVKAFRDMVQDTAVAVESFELKRSQDLEIAGETLLSLEATTPYADILTYPGDWPELTAARLKGLSEDASESVANRAAQASLRKLVSLNGDNLSLDQVVSFVRDSTGANVAVNWPALELVGVLPETVVSINLERAPAEALLKQALDQAAAKGEADEQIGFGVDEGVVKVTTLLDLRADTDTRVYDIRAFLNQPSEQSREDRVAQMIEQIKHSVDAPKLWVDGQYIIQELNGNLIVKTTAVAHMDVARVIEQFSTEVQVPDQADPNVVPPVNPWVLTEHDAQSTFALDTDTASYELARRTIREQAQLPPIASVRMEEFVNRFDYQYPAGRDAHDTFTVHADAAPAPFAGSSGGEAVLMKVGVRGRVVARDQMKPAHYVFVIDASGSMSREDRLPLVRQSLAMLLGQLGEKDTVSLVSYETRPYLLLEHAPARDAKAIMQAAATIQTGGSTNLTDGLKLGYQVASKHFAPGSVNRVILCSDGVANVGNDDAKQMLDAVDRYRKHGVTLMAVGVGVDGQSAGQAASGAERFNDGLMEQLANRGDGQYVYLGSAEDAHRQFVDDLAATRPTIAYDAKIQVAFDPARVRRYRLIGYENRAIADRDFRNDAVDAGEVGSGQSATALYELELWPTHRRRPAVQATEGPGKLATVYVRYRDARSNQVQETATAFSLAQVGERTVSEDPRFYLAACAAEFAELLRNSEHAAHGSYDRLHRIAREVAEALPLDKDAAELAELIGRSQGLPRAGQ